jgi:hypothetical protein
VISWFQASGCKCDLYRYSSGYAASTAAQQLPIPASGKSYNALTVGGCTG